MSGAHVRGARLLFVVNADWFFVSHRLTLARACREAGYDVTVCAGESDCRDRIESAGMRFIPLPIDRGGTHPARDARTLRALYETYRQIRPDIVHHVTIKPVLYGSFAARAARVRAVVNAVSGLGYAFIERQEPKLRHALLRRSLRIAYRAALGGQRTRVIFQNDDDRNAFVAGGLVEARRTRLIRGSGVDLERFTPASLPSGPFVALVPSRLLWDKGIGEFVEAARRLKVNHPEARFVLVGRLDPANPAAISEHQVRAWVNERVVEWWGPRSPDAMPEAYRSAHVVVLPSYREGLPLALAEAAACGRAVITTDTAGCRDVIAPDSSGWLVRVRDAASLEKALAAAISNRDELERRGQRGVALARERFGLQSVVSATLETYRDLLTLR